MGPNDQIFPTFLTHSYRTKTQQQTSSRLCTIVLLLFSPSNNVEDKIAYLDWDWTCILLITRWMSRSLHHLGRLSYTSVFFFFNYWESNIFYSVLRYLEHQKTCPKVSLSLTMWSAFPFWITVSGLEIIKFCQRMVLWWKLVSYNLPLWIDIYRVTFLGLYVKAVLSVTCRTQKKGSYSYRTSKSQMELKYYWGYSLHVLEIFAKFD